MSDTQDVEALVAEARELVREKVRSLGSGNWIMGLDAHEVDEETNELVGFFRQAIDTLARERDEQHDIVARIWKLLGSPSYEDLAGRSIYDLIEELKADRARASSLEAQLAGAKEALEDMIALSEGDISGDAQRTRIVARARAVYEALASAPASIKEPAPMTKQPVTVRAYVDEYEFRGDEACHTPTENERAMIEDAIEGYLFEIGASAPASAGVARRVRHKKRGSTYEVIGAAEGQVSNGKVVSRTPTGPDDTGLRCSVRLAEGDTVMVYRCLETGKLWWRVPGEFEDGRFEDLTPSEWTGRRCGRE